MAYPHPNRHAHAAPNGDQAATRHARTNAHAVATAFAYHHPQPNSKPVAHCDLDAHSNPNLDANRDQPADANQYQHTHARAAHRHVDARTQPNLHARAFSHSHRNAAADGHGRTADANAAADYIALIQEKSNMDLTALLKKLANAQGISGHEEPIRAIVLDEFTRYTDETRINRIGSAIGLKCGRGAPPRRAVMLAAHMDQVGLMVSGIEKGFLRLARVGGTDERILLGQEIIVHGRRDLPGLIGSRPPHVLPADQHKQTIPLKEIFADVGLPEAQVNQLVRVGDLVSLRREVIELKNGLLAGQAFDDRAAVAALIVCLEALKARPPEWDVWAVATIQEETRLLGAATVAYELNPDVAIAIDVTFGAQPGVPESKSYGLDKGPVIGIGPNVHPRVSRALVDAAKRLEMNYQMDPIPGPSGTDGWAIQVAREGIPTGVLSIPLRYMHTPVETVAVKDVERVGRLLAEFIYGLDQDFVQALTYSD